MQKLRAERYSFSVSQSRSSTISRCISAIWPAGPPKERSPIRAQTFRASANVTPAGEAFGLSIRSSIVAPMSKSTHSLADLYDLSITRLFLTGPQAILRMVLMQSERDRQAGLDTAGYVSGYRGSPVGTVDNQFQAARQVLEPRNIVFQPGLNEDLAATACWGTQQAEMRGEGKHDGVFGLWYGKGPGVDRTGDVFRHANMAGTSPHGGVLAIAGDDHSGESSTVVHASDVALMDAMIPVLSPAGVQEIIDFGLLGLALSRHAGVWVGLKCVHDTVESSAVVEAGPDRVTPGLPEGARAAAGRPVDPPQR